MRRRRRRPGWAWTGYKFSSQRAFRKSVRLVLKLMRPARQRFDLIEDDG
jgi:hypothetical protein